MSTLQIDQLVSVLVNPDSTDRYYWSEVFYVDSSDTSGFPGWNVDMLFTMESLHIRNVTLHGYRVHEAPGDNTIIASHVYSPPRTGLVGPVWGNYTLLNIARWTIYTEGRKTYKLHRMPMRDIDLDGDMLSTGGWLRSQGAANSMVATGKFRNRYGELITSIEVDRKVHMWQLRHGVKRRTRQPFTL